MLEDPLLCGGGLAFLMTCLRTAAHEETEFLTVLKIPFRVRTPFSSKIMAQHIFSFESELQKVEIQGQNFEKPSGIQRTLSTKSYSPASRREGVPRSAPRMGRYNGKLVGGVG